MVTNDRAAVRVGSAGDIGCVSGSVITYNQVGLRLSRRHHPAKEAETQDPSADGFMKKHPEY